MGSKVRIPSDVARAIEHVWTNYKAFPFHQKHVVLTDFYSLERLYPKQWEIIYPFYKEYPVEYTRAIVEGYEIDKTPHDLLAEYYERLTCTYRKTEAEYALDEAMAKGILVALQILNIGVEGINKFGDDDEIL